MYIVFSRVLLPPLSIHRLVSPFLDSGPNGVADLCFNTYGEFFHVNFSTWPSFLVACYATLHPALLVGPSVCPSSGLSVRPSHFTFLTLMGVLALLLLPKCFTDLNYGPSPPARDWGSCVSGLVPMNIT